MGRYKLADAYREHIHKPRVGNIVLYIPKAGGDGLTQHDMNMLNNAEIMKHKDNFMNSPTNIRRVWMTYKRVIVEYYAAPIEKGRPATTGLFKEHEISEDVLGLIKKMLTYAAADISQRSMSKLEPVKLEGRTLQALTHPYTLNNLEEIFIDWTAFATEDAGIILKQCGIEQMHMLYNYMNGIRLGSSKDNPNLGILPLRLFAGPEKIQISTSYKRLKTVAMISNLEGVLNKLKETGEFNNTVETFRLDNVLPNSTSWLNNETVVNWINASGSDVWLGKQSGAITTNFYDVKDPKRKTFEIKSNQYAFDDMHLKVKIESYSAKLKDNELQKITSKTKPGEDSEEGNITEPIEEGTVEAEFQRIIDSYEKPVAKSILAVALRVFKEINGGSNKIVFGSIKSVKLRQKYSDFLQK